MEATFRDKRSTYSSLTCLGGDYGQFAKFFSSLMKMFSWHHITFIYNQNPAISGKGEMILLYFSTYSVSLREYITKLFVIMKF